MSTLSTGYNFKMFHHLAKMILNLMSQAQPKICVWVCLKFRKFVT